MPQEEQWNIGNVSSEVTGQLHASAAFPLGKEPSAHIT
jgi:hypothetical protein